MKSPSHKRRVGNYNSSRYSTWLANVLVGNYREYAATVGGFKINIKLL